ncbi:sensor histidine kinase [Candidatus Woesearchaeota archaeon]|nr:sensor histidine kinase [Candidatus Woesearchaeota archaeon]
MAEYTLIPNNNKMSREDFLETIILRRGHDYNNAFYVIKGTVRLYRNGVERISEAEQELFKSADHALSHIEFINQALEDLTSKQLTYEEVDVFKTIKFMKEFLKCKNSNIEDTIKLTIDNISILASQSLFYQQIYSFVSNAINSYNHTNLERIVEISAREYLLDETEIDLLGNNKTKMIGGEPFVDISVKDYGIGIDEKRLSKIFEKGHSTCGTKGIGLALSKMSAELLCGYIHVESAPNEGSTFSLRFHQNGGLV